MMTLHETVDNIIEHVTCEINDLLENHKMTNGVRQTLMEHIDNLKDAVIIHSMIMEQQEEHQPVTKVMKQSAIMKPIVTMEKSSDKN